MDEKKLNEVTIVNDHIFTYHGERVIKLQVPQIGPAQVISYDINALKYCLNYCGENKIPSPIFYILKYCIRPFFGELVKKAHKLGVCTYQPRQ
jgi:rhamnosyltransferase